MRGATFDSGTNDERKPEGIDGQVERATREVAVRALAGRTCLGGNLIR